MYGIISLLLSRNIDVVQKLIIIGMLALLCMITYLIILNIKTLLRVSKLKPNDKLTKIDDPRYYELNNKFQLVTVISSILLLIGGFLGYDSIDSIKSDIQGKMDEYVKKLEGYEFIINKYDTLIPNLEYERNATSESLSKIKLEYENAVRSYEQLQNDYRLSAKTYFVKGIQMGQKLSEENTNSNRIYFKELKKINNRIPVVFKEEPFITVVGIGGFNGLSIIKITKEYFEYAPGGSVQFEDVLLGIFPLQNEDSINKEEIRINNYINSVLNKSLIRNSKKDNITDATSFDLIIIEGINN